MRKSLITRTVKYTQVSCLCVTTENGNAESKNLTFTLSKKHSNTPKTLKMLRAKYETDTLHIATIIDCTVVEERRKMTEEYFIDHSELMDINEEADDALAYTE